MIIRNNNLILGKINGIGHATEVKKVNNTDPPNQNEAFGKILNDKLQETQNIKFSKHAELRLRSRNIELSHQQKEKLNDAVNRAGTKGINDSLVIMDNMAFVVNVKNKTVITAMNGNELRDSVFTNIDGAVIA